MNITNILSRLSRSPIPCFVIVTLITLSCITPGYCGEIHDAAKRGDLAKVQELLKDNPVLVSSKDNNGHTPLHYAALTGHKEITELLLANQTDVNAKTAGGEPPSFEGPQNGRTDISGWTPLHYAALTGHKEITELLLSNRADINAMCNDGETPLHKSALRNKKEVAELLLSHGAEINGRNNDGKTPLTLAAEGKGSPWKQRMPRKDIVELLRQHGGHE
jgi:ankyrin repeat protein